MNVLEVPVENSPRASVVLRLSQLQQRLEVERSIGLHQVWLSRSSDTVGVFLRWIGRSCRRIDGSKDRTVDVDLD